MTKLARGGIFSGLRLGFVGAALMTSVLQLSGCTSANDTGPLLTAQPSGLSSGAARKTGTFPNLNIAPQVAASQLSDTEKNAKLSELQGAQSTQTAVGGSGPVPNDQAVLKKIAATHGQKTLSEIEGK